MSKHRNFNCSMHCIVHCKPEHQIALSSSFKSGSMHWNRWLLTTKKNRICLSDHSLQTPATFAIQSNSEYSTWMSWTDRMFRFRWPRGGEWVTPTWKCFAFSSLFHLPWEQYNLALILLWFLLNPVVMQFLHSFWSTLHHAWLLDRYTLACHS